MYVYIYIYIYKIYIYLFIYLFEKREVYCRAKQGELVAHAQNLIFIFKLLMFTQD